MPTVQERIAALQRAASQEETEAQAAAIIDAVKAQESLLAAFFPQTKHYYILREFGQQTAVLFTNRDSFERFAERSFEQGIRVAAIENARADRMLLFADLKRCGFTRVCIDVMPESVNFQIGDFYSFPDLSALPLVQRSVLNPEMTGKILWLFQQIHSGRADGGMELEMLSELYHSPFLLPVERIKTEHSMAHHVPVREEEGKRRAWLYTDRREWASSGTDRELYPTIARYAEMRELLQNGFDQIVINPGSGAELVLDEQLLMIAEKAAMGQTEDLTLQTMQEQGEKITITDPQEIPDDLRRAFLGVLQNHPEVTAAYLRVIKRENSLRPRWLLLHERTEDRGEKALHQELYKAAQPYLQGYDFECASYSSARPMAGSAKPFYQKRRFGFFK